MPTHPLYQLHQVNWSIGKTPILRNVDLAIPSGQVVGIIGPNGAGKTSLLKVLNGHAKDVSGDVLYAGQSLQELSISQIAKRIAYAAQHPNFSFSLTLEDVVRAGRLPHTAWYQSSKADQTIIDQALAQFSLADKAQQAFHTLSGGEQQRTFLARTMVQQAETILLDEPTNHLDIHHQLQLMQDLSNFSGNVIMTLHDLNIAAQYCDYLILMAAGKVVGAGSPDEVLKPESLSSVYNAIFQLHRLPNQRLQLAYCLPEEAHHA